MVYRLHLVYWRGCLSLADKTDRRIIYRRRPSLGVNLLRTCRQIHDEAAQILYGENIFCVAPTFRINAASAIHQDLLFDAHSNSRCSEATLYSMGSINRAMIRNVSALLRVGTHQLTRA